MLRKPDVVTSSATRFSLHTETCGIVHFTCYVLLMDKSPKTDQFGLPPNVARGAAFRSTRVAGGRAFVGVKHGISTQVTHRPVMFKFPPPGEKPAEAVSNPLRDEEEEVKDEKDHPDYLGE